MSNSSATSHQAALQVVRQAAISIADWAKGEGRTTPQQPAALQLVFDRIHLPDGHPHPNQPNYRPATSLEFHGAENTPRIPYAVGEQPTDFTQLKADICQATQQLDWENLSQLMMFLEVYSSHLSWQNANPDIVIADQAKSAAAIAAALAQNPPNQQLALVGGDLMGVQNFIYTISSEGALKSLRARSFYLELATEEVVQQLLTELNLPRTNVIYSGASKFYLLVAATDNLKHVLEQIQLEFNHWLLETFQRKVFLAIAHESFAVEQLNAASNSDQPGLAQIWQQVNDQLAEQGKRKFVHQINKILERRPSFQPCKVCQRDDQPEEKLQPLSSFPGEESVLACATCRAMFTLGDHLPEVKTIVRSPRKYDDNDILIQSIYYHLTEHINWQAKPDEIVFQINNWTLKAYPSDQFIPLLLGNYFQSSPETCGFLSANEMAKASEGIERVGYLRMDVDRLSQIFSKGLGDHYTLPRLTSLSRQMTYFFKVYLNSLAAYRAVNFTNHKQADGNATFESLAPQSARQHLLFIYAGGDDLFVSGAWNEVVDFAFDVYQAFRAYTGYHPDITLSAGVCIAGAKFPLYQAAAEAGEVEKVAKGNGRDSLGLFGAALKWDEWLGRMHPTVMHPDDFAYLNAPVKVDKPALFGVLPFVKHLYAEVGQGYTRSFVRNLLNTAQVQEAKIEEAQKKSPDQVRDVRYFLHLPKVAYTLARLPDKALTNADFRQSLKSSYNAPYFRAIATWLELLNR